MVDRAGVFPTKESRAIAVLRGKLAATPLVRELPAERRDYCRLAIEAADTTFECDAYDAVARQCADILKGREIVVRCRIVPYRQNGATFCRNPVLGFIVQSIRVLAR